MWLALSRAVHAFDIQKSHLVRNARCPESLRGVNRQICMYRQSSNPTYFLPMSAQCLDRHYPTALHVHIVVIAR